MENTVNIRTMTAKHILSLGAGVQSSTLALMAAAGEVTPMPMAAIFADTQAEPSSVYRWLDWLEKQLPFPVYRVTAGSLTESLLRVRHRADGAEYSASGIPFFFANKDGSRGQVMRQCTRDYKIRPITKEVRRICGVLPYQRHKEPVVTQWIGISLDEIRRMKESRDTWAKNRWPLIELRMSRSDCVDWMKSRGLPAPPRSACVYCPYHQDREWSHLKHSEPEAFDEACRVERELQSIKSRTDRNGGIPYLHSSLKSLDTVDFDDDGHNQLSLWQDECEGMCGV